MLKRKSLLSEISKSVKRNSITVLLGPRQCGKTTISKMLLKKESGVYFDLKDSLQEVKFQNPQMLFDAQKGLIILDEIQRKPELMPVLRVYADKKPLRQRFLLLGSASPELMKKASESLAGRAHFIDMSGFSMQEIDCKNQNRLWVRGGFPKSYISGSDSESISWRNDFIRTFLERDILQYGININPINLRRFWGMLSHYHAQVWNGSEMGSNIGVSHTTVRRYLDALSSAFMVRQLMPFYENMGKRIVKSPKIYIRDSGIFHTFMNIPSYRDLIENPKIGASWEGFALEQILLTFGDREAYFWHTHNGAELDLLLIRKGRRYGFEFKCSDAPTITKSMKIVKNDLKLSKLWVIYPGKDSYDLDKNCKVVPLKMLNSIKF